MDATPNKEPEKIMNVEGFYFNGFAIGVGNADFTLTLKVDNRPVTVLKASYTTAKTLAEKLTAMVTRFEKTTNHDLMTTETVAALLKNFEPKKETQEDSK